ncbi:hypothetical protein JZ751_025914 [Albula glossodonta]|uniref:Uncharacterized protein n=1 Tax=Albula glossodonta TaxID=121402 RepID=A0A8T2NDB4_9TELE|nr:hypothetical protein JZ751_025914 [Albula glossodonta]
MEAKNMECFKVMGGNTVACNTEGVSTDLCCIKQQFPYIAIQWTTEVDITCKNETFDDQLTVFHLFQENHRTVELIRRIAILFAKEQR